MVTPTRRTTIEIDLQAMRQRIVLVDDEIEVLSRMPKSMAAQKRLKAIAQRIEVILDMMIVMDKRCTDGTYWKDLKQLRTKFEPESE